MVVLLSKDQLREARSYALRRRVWYLALDDVERNIVNLSIRLVERVKSPALAAELNKILAKIREASKNVFTRHIDAFGRRKVRQVVDAAVGFGNYSAVDWLRSDSLEKLLALNDYYNVAEWKVPR